VLASPSPASAFYGATHAYADCREDYGTPNAYVSGGNVLTTSSLVMTCPVTDSSDLARGSLTKLDAYYDDETTSTYVIANRCVTYQTVIGGNCGSAVQSSVGGTGVGVLHVPNTPSTFASDWNGPTGFGYIEIILPQKTGASPSRILGFYEQV
jgi:hypothetical protein